MQDHLPRAHGLAARYALLGSTRRTVPLRRSFVQQPPRMKERIGPLARFVTGRDPRGLRAYLLLVAAGSAPDNTHTTVLDTLVWARLFDPQLPATDQAARMAARRVLKRLQQRSLIDYSQRQGSSKATVTLLREDASRQAYSRPGSSGDAYLRLTMQFWLQGLDAKLDLPALAMLLAVAAEPSWCAFPAERMLQWYGWSADTTLRGLQTLTRSGMVKRRATSKAAPLTPSGSTLVYQYMLTEAMRSSAPVGASID